MLEVSGWLSKTAHCTTQARCSFQGAAAGILLVGGFHNCNAARADQGGDRRGRHAGGSHDAGVVHARGGDGQTPLHCASTAQIAAFLLDHGADIDARDVDHESTPAQYMVSDRQDGALPCFARLYDGSADGGGAR